MHPSRENTSRVAINMLAVAAVTLALLSTRVRAFHDCVQPKSIYRRPGAGAALEALRRGDNLPLAALQKTAEAPLPGCAGGLCVGMHNGPHEGGPASYTVGNSQDGFIALYSTQRVPALPRNETGICYYLWTDLFMGDMSWGRMNQFVPQLILGDALDGSTGPPNYDPHYGHHYTWMFGAHYFFEIFDGSNVQAKAAYGDLYPTVEGETVFTSFVASEGAPGKGPVWTLEMGVVGDASRTSRIVIDQPYMGFGASWPVPTTRWDELNYTNICINACWEIYGGIDPDHLPSSGTTYDLKITRGAGQTYPWATQWDRDEGAGTCFADAIAETHTALEQHVYWTIETQGTMM